MKNHIFIIMLTVMIFILAIPAQGRNGLSTGKNKVAGLTVEIAEITFDNGKYYKAVPVNSKEIRAILRMKMKGTGIVRGYWEVDDRPFEFFSEMVRPGELKEIRTSSIPGLPVTAPGIHTLTVILKHPSNQITFPILKYYVLPGKIPVEILAPADRFVVKEDEVPEFSWNEARGASSYQIGFCNYLYPLLSGGYGFKWIDVEKELKYTPGAETWAAIKRNQWTYWKVRALDFDNNVMAESDIHEIKVVAAGADINIDKVTDLEGREIYIADGNRIHAKTDSLLVHGSFQYRGDSQYIVLRVYVDNKLTDQLVFRDVKKDRQCYFETFIPNWEKTSQVVFNLLKTSSPSVIIGIKELILKK
jgi:hypothetical protein